MPDYPEPQMTEQERRIAAAKRAKTMKRILWISFFVLLAGGLAYAAVYFGKSAPGSGDGPGESFPSQGQDHVPLRTPFAYNSNPPSSGPHYASQANWGIYDYEVLDQIFLHNLEHGGIWIAYRPTIAPQALEDLKAIVKELAGRKIVMAPRSANGADVAVVSWTRVLTFDLAGGGLSNEQKALVRAFHRAWINHAPEQVPDLMPGIDPKSVQ